MKAFSVFVLICVAGFVSVAASSAGPCDKIDNYRWDTFDLRKTCFMSSIVIDSTDFFIKPDRDEIVEGFFAVSNDKLTYLPNNLGVTFPNLLALHAGACSIKAITKNNFEGLSKLRRLTLPINQIEKIDDDTFDGIPAVELIWLSWNKIKRLNGRAFASLHKLTWVWLDDNECMVGNFNTAEKIAEMPRIVAEKCGFSMKMECNIEKSLSEKAKLEADIKAQSEKLSNLRAQLLLVQQQRCIQEQPQSFSELTSP